MFDLSVNNLVCRLHIGICLHASTDHICIDQFNKTCNKPLQAIMEATQAFVHLKLSQAASGQAASDRAEEDESLAMHVCFWPQGGRKQ